MKRNDNLGIIISVAAIAATIATIVSGIIMYFEKKKRYDMELEQYLDCSIR